MEVVDVAVFWPVIIVRLLVISFVSVEVPHFCSWCIGSCLSWGFAVDPYFVVASTLLDTLSVIYISSRLLLSTTVGILFW